MGCNGGLLPLAVQRQNVQNFRGLRAPAPLFPGLTQPRAQFFGGYAPPDLFFPGLPGPKPRVHFCTHKSEPKKRQPPLGWTPALSNRTLAKEHCAATEFPQGRWLLVIGLVGYQLRLSALGMISTSC